MRRLLAGRLWEQRWRAPIRHYLVERAEARTDEMLDIAKDDLRHNRVTGAMHMAYLRNK